MAKTEIIKYNDCDNNRLRFYPTGFCSLPLPLRSVGNRYIRSVTNCGTIDMISSKFVPYGMYGRLALIAMTSLAKDTDAVTRTTDYDSLYLMLEKLNGKKPTGPQFNKFKNQLLALCTTLVTFNHISTNQRSVSNMILVDKATFLSMEKCGTKEYTGTIRFSETGYKFLNANAMPIPVKALHEIVQPFKFDVLVWLLVSLYPIRRGQRVMIPWLKLYEQYGVTEEVKKHNFRHTFSMVLDEVAEKYYPDARFSIDVSRGGGIMLETSPRLLFKDDTCLTPLMPF